MTAGYGNMNAGVSYPVSTHGYGEVVFQGEVNASVVLVGLARLCCTIIEGVVKQWGFLT